ncbi:MAG: hypothetical protein U0Q16_22260 [Bryobacteraceae bacterium]
MSEARYVPVPQRSREDLIAALKSEDPTAIHDALISAAYWDEWKWAQDQCLAFADHPSETVRAASAYGLNLIAVFHAKLDLDIVLPVLEKLRQDPAVASYAEEALEDINHFFVTLKGMHTADRLPPA